MEEEKKPMMEKTEEQKKKEKEAKKDEETTSSTCKGLIWAGVAIGLLIVVFIICMIKMEQDEKSKRSRITGPGDHIIDDE